MRCTLRLVAAMGFLTVLGPSLWAQDPAIEQERAVTAIRALGGKADVTSRGAGASTATVRSAKTVSARVTSQTLMSVFVSFRSCGISRHSPML